MAREEKFSPEKNAKESEIAIINRYAIICYSVMAVILLLSYLIEVIKGNRTIGYYVVFFILAAWPWVSGVLCYRWNKDRDTVKHFLAIGYGIFYTFVIFTSTSVNAFVYVIPLMVVLTLYSDMRFSMLNAITATIANVAHVVYVAMTVGIGKTEMPDYEINLAAIILVGIFSSIVTKILKDNNERKMAEVNREKENIALLLDKIMATSAAMTEVIETVSGKVNNLENSVLQTKDSMEEVSTGTNETAESIQHQLVKTEEIQRFIQSVEVAVEAITKDMETAQKEVDGGSEKMNAMIKKVEEAEHVNEEVSSELNKLNEYTGRMQSIVGIITGITSQTSLLALNASIEAARAGEAGRGFAVVASEISGLAKQTQEATEHITELIGNVAEELERVVKVIQQMLESNELQGVAAKETAESFHVISEKTENVSGQAEELAYTVKALAQSNAVIVESIQTISAITEEVTAHSNETFVSSEENSRITKEVTALTERLHQMAMELKAETE